jgi:hypothetical protein
MDNIYYGKIWRIINLILTSLGMSMPWFKFYFDMLAPGVNISPPIGWLFLLSNILEVIQHLSLYGFKVVMLPFWLTSIGGISIVVYLVFNVFLLIGNKNSSHKIFSVSLIGTVIFFSFYMFIGGKPLLGYALMNLGLISSAIFEWQNSKSKDIYLPNTVDR